jgi:hypothetical protein
LSSGRRTLSSTSLAPLRWISGAISPSMPSQSLPLKRRAMTSARQPTLASAYSSSVRAVRRVDVDEDEADPRRRELGDDPLVPVRRPDADAVAAAQAEREQARGHLVGALLQVVPGQAQVLGVEDRRVARAVAATVLSSCCEIVMKRSGSSVEPETYESVPCGAARSRAAGEPVGAERVGRHVDPRRRFGALEVAPVAELLEGVRGAVDRRLA